MTITIQDQTIHYTIHGNGLPIIILHGLYLDSISMKHAIEDSEMVLEGFKRIYIDMPGMGQSPRHQLDNNSDTMLDLISKLITILISNHPFIVVGYSYGGYIAQGIAKRFKTQVIGEVLICPVVIPDMSKRRRSSIVNQEIDENFFNSYAEAKTNRRLQSMVVINERSYRRSEADFSRAIALCDRDFVKDLFKPENYASEYIEEMKVVHPHKTLIFLGYQDATVGYLDMLDRLHMYPKATVNLLANASHSFFLEQPTQFEHILGSWLKQYKL